MRTWTAEGLDDGEAQSPKSAEQAGVDQVAPESHMKGPGLSSECEGETLENFEREIMTLLTFQPSFICLYTISSLHNL